MRRPKAGEYRALREQLEQQQDEAIVAVSGVQEANRAATADLPDDKLPPVEVQLALRQRNRDLQRMLEGQRAAWMRRVFDTLADKPLEAEDNDLPVWFSVDSAAIDLIKHWQTRPSHPGAR